MGNFSSRRSKNEIIHPQKRRKPDIVDVKVMLMGTGDSGKSTLFKQLKVIYEQGYSEDDLGKYKSVIYYNIIESSGILCRELLKNKVKFESEQNEEAAKRIAERTQLSSGRLSAHHIYDNQFATDLEGLMEESVMKEIFERRREFHIFDGADYFFKDLQRIREPYEPSVADILHCRRKSTGVNEGGFLRDGVRFRFIDVGGQRPERKKWINLFDGTNALVYVVSLSDYDQKCYEDDTTNRMEEAIDLFDEVCNGRWFQDKLIILVFNKVDIFAEKIKNSSLNKTFSDYYGDSPEEALAFITEKFLEVNKYDPRRIFCRYTDATDTEQVTEVFESSRKILIRSVLPNSPGSKPYTIPLNQPNKKTTV
ncbi:heterotrimeric G protein subunit alpha [Acrasis kona]|uniref:Heterotrimeric G protein subunit alpha n=1 Tax=Acrasis kona TaxID=1008807 RepID=A0AAW2YLX9_9EUKA